MEIKFDKYLVIFQNCYEEELKKFMRIILAPIQQMDEGFKCLGFFLKIHKYKIMDLS